LTDETELYTAAEIEEVANEAARLALSSRSPIETEPFFGSTETVKRDLNATKLSKYFDSSDNAG